MLLKGGHLTGDRLVDMLATPEGITRFEDARIETRHTHGTGCTLASAIAAGLAQGMPLQGAVARARAYVRAAILAAPGYRPWPWPARPWRDARSGAAGGPLMRRYPFVTVDVFTDRQFGGNQLAVFPDARGISDAEMQALAAELNLSETTFVLPPADPANTARVRIFHRTAEMPFAGHPNVGTGFVLADRASAGLLRFEEIAGIVEVRLDHDAAGQVTGATIAAPQALAVGPELPLDLAAACAGIAPEGIVTARHMPTIAADGGNPRLLLEVTPAAMAAATPDLPAFRRAVAATPSLGGKLSLYLYRRMARGCGRGCSRRWPAPGRMRRPAARRLRWPASCWAQRRRERRLGHRPGGRDGPAQPAPHHGAARAGRHPRDGRRRLRAGVAWTCGVARRGMPQGPLTSLVLFREAYCDNLTK